MLLFDIQRSSQPSMIDIHWPTLNAHLVNKKYVSGISLTSPNRNIVSISSGIAVSPSKRVESHISYKEALSSDDHISVCTDTKEENRKSMQSARPKESVPSLVRKGRLAEEQPVWINIDRFIYLFCVVAAIATHTHLFVSGKAVLFLIDIHSFHSLFLPSHLPV